MSVRSKREDIEFLHAFRDSLKGAPLEVCRHTVIFFPDLAVRADLVHSKITVYDVSEEEGKIWVPCTQTFLFIPSEYPLARAKDQRIKYIDYPGVLLQLMMETVNVECFPRRAARSAFPRPFRVQSGITPKRWDAVTWISCFSQPPSVTYSTS